MNTEMKPCMFLEDQSKCDIDYAPKSPIDKTCWRYRVELGHCNHPDDIEEKGSFGQDVR